MNQYADELQAARDGFSAPRPVQVVATAADVQILTMESRLCGWSLGESTGAAAAKCYLRDGAGAAAPIVAVINLAISGSSHEWLGDDGLLLPAGLYLDVASGSVEGALWIRTPA